jgi:predicted CXXCH cytochrome family protein
MKKIALAIVFAAYASTTLAAVAGGPHDLTSAANKVGAYGTAAVGTTPCQFCHTPHKANASATFATAPLWNRSALAVTFTMYDQAKLTAGNTVDATPNAASMTCLTCHEGSATLGTVYSTTSALLTGGTNTTMVNSGMMQLGTNLNDDHPVSFLYPIGGSAAFEAGTATGVAGFPLYSSKVECATCHDPHLTGANFLRATAATLCGLCHINK